ncbi:hypothetical protein C8Q77DRAFT_208911 [Trametes polyzona]|nr:hypothetical protein C8Q77DRAFT_208911 [Trametes polyzona]
MAHSSQSSRQPMSGLRSIKRDFSSNSLPATSQSSAASDPDSIPWDPTPPKKLSGLEQRLKDIQDALNAQISSSENTLSQSQKRPSTSQNPPAKRRQLPPSWDAKEVKPSHTHKTAYTSVPRAVGTSRNMNVPETLVVPAATKNGAVSKPAPVFLSQEQTHILRLVESGKSLFYTGSAGELYGYFTTDALALPNFAACYQSASGASAWIRIRIFLLVLLLCVALWTVSFGRAMHLLRI